VTFLQIVHENLSAALLKKKSRSFVITHFAEPAIFATSHCRAVVRTVVFCLNKLLAYSFIPYGQTPLYEQVGQLVVQRHQQTCWALVLPAAQHLDIGSRLPEPSKLANKLVQWSLSANKLYNKFVSGAPDTNLLVDKLPTCSYNGVWPLPADSGALYLMFPIYTILFA
jgi:hypothetical protein